MEFPFGYLGAQAKFYEWGLNVDSHPDPKIVVNSNELSITFIAKKPVKVTTKLVSCADDKDYSDFSFTHNYGNRIVFMVMLPHVGWWKLQVFVLPSDCSEKSLLGVFNYAIECKEVTTPAYPFPKQYKAWDNQCELIEPLHLNREVCGDNVHFKVSVKDATKVAVVVNEQWFHLFPSHDTYWEADVAVGQYYNTGTRLTLNLNRTVEGRSYDTALEYRL